MIQRPFEISAMALTKFGWGSLRDVWGYHRKIHLQDENAILFFEKHDPFLTEPITYYIQEIVSSNILEYRFKSYRTSKPDAKGKLSFEIIDDIEIKSNVELFKKIIETEAFVESYARHFKINKLIK